MIPLLRSLWKNIPLLLLCAGISAGCVADPRIVWRATGAPGDLQIRALAVNPHNPQILYAGLYSHGFQRSADGGITWQSHNNGLSLSEVSTDNRPRNVRALAVSQTDPALLFLGSEGGLYRTTDGGDSWQLTFPNPSSLFDFYSVDAIASVLIDGEERFFAGTRAGLFVFDGEVWQPTELVGAGFQASAILIHPDNPRHLLVGTKAAGIFRSQDGGLSWAQIGQPFAERKLWVSKLVYDSSGQLLAGTLGDIVNTLGDGVYALTADGWQPRNNGLPANANIWLLYANPENGALYTSVSDERTYRWESTAWQPLDFPYALYSLVKLPASGDFLAGTRGYGAYTLSPELADWRLLQLRSPGETGAHIHSLLTLPINRGQTTLLVAGTDVNGVFTRTTGEEEWRRGQGFPIVHRRIFSLAVGGEDDAGPRLYAGSFGGGVYRSQDGGALWEQLPNTGLEGESLPVLSLGVIAGDEDRIYAGTRIGLFRFDNASQKWHSVDGLMGQMPSAVVIPALHVDRRGELFAAVSNFGLFRSAEGESWQSVTPNLLEDPIFVSGLESSTKSFLGRWLHGADRFFAINYDSLYSSDTVFDPTRSTDWDRRISGQFGALAVDPFHPQIIYAGAFSATVGIALTPTYPSLISLDNGSSWRDAGTLNHPVNALAADPTRPGILYAGTDSGVYIGEVTLPILWREVLVWSLLFSPLLLLTAFLGFVYLSLSLPYGIPLPTAARLLLFRRNALALALVEPSPLSSLQQLILAAGEELPVWSSQEMAALLDSENANASSAQLAAALDQLTRQFGLLTVDSDGRYRAAIPGLGRVFRWRVEARRGLLAKDVREENAIFQDSRDFFRQAGFAVHTRRDLLLLTPLQASWAELTSQSDDAPLLARILAGGAPTVADLDESLRLAAAEYNNDARGRLLFLVVSTAPDAAARRHIRQIRQDARLALVLISHTAIYQALRDGAAPSTLQVALRRQRGEISPAEISGPVLDPLDFFDRTELLATVREKLAAGESLLLCGPPQIGKSSLVWQAARQLDNFLLSYAEFSAGPAWEEQMLGDLIDGLVRDGSRKYARTEWPFDPATVRSTIHSMADFAGTVRAMGEAISLAATRPRLALLVDGLNETTLGWWPQLVAACQRQSGQQIGLVGVVASGLVLPADGGQQTADGGQQTADSRRRTAVNGQRTAVNGQRSTVSGQQLAVGPFAPAAALEMAGAMADQAGIGLDGNAAQALVEASGGHPFLLRRLFGAAQLEADVQSRRKERGEMRIDGESVAAGIHRHVASNPIYGRWWMALSAQEQAAVLAVGAGEGGVDPGVGSRLVALGWLQANDTGYRLAAGALHVWLEWMGLL